MNKKTICVIAIIVVLVVAIIVIRNINIKNKNENVKTTQNIEGSLESIMEKLYEGISEDDLPILSNTEVTKENVEYYLGTDDIDFLEAIASEPVMTSIAHSVVLVRVDNNANVEEIANKIKANVNPAKWICVEVDKQNVKVETKGNLILLVMVNENFDTIVSNFERL